MVLDTSGDCQYSRLSKLFPSVGSTRFEVHFAIRPASPWPDVLPFALGLDTSNDADYCALILYANSSQNGTINQGQINIQQPQRKPNSINNLTGFPPNDEWSQVDIVATKLSGGGAHFKIDITPTVGNPSSDDFDAPQCSPWTAADVNFGFHCSTGQATADYDNIWVDWQ